MGEIWVENEYAPLKTVVLAQSEICVPRSALEDLDMSFLPEWAQQDKIGTTQTARYGAVGPAVAPARRSAPVQLAGS